MGLKCTFVKHLPSLGQQESCPFFCIRLTYFCILFLSTATTCEPLLYVTRVAKQLPRPALSNSIQCRLNRSPVRPSPYGEKRNSRMWQSPLRRLRAQCLSAGCV